MKTESELMKWSKDLSVDLNEIDSQHQKLIEIMNKLFSAMKSGSVNQVLKGLTKELEDYTKYHFDIEENYFKKFNYLDSSAHISQHAEFRAKVRELSIKINKEELTFSVDLLNYLLNWIKNHIVIIDKKYVPTFKENGVK